MFDYILQNFNWPTFFMALAAFALISSLLNFIVAVINNQKAQRRLQIAEKKYQELQSQLKVKGEEYDRLLGKKESK